MFNKGSSIGYEATHGTSNVLVDLHYFLHATWLLNVLNNAIAYCHIVPYEKGNMPTGFKKYTDVEKKNILLPYCKGKQNFKDNWQTSS